MLSISVGPIALPVAPVLLLVAVWTASWTAVKLASRQTGATDPSLSVDSAGRAVWLATGIGLLAARLAHLASIAQPYLMSPVSMLDLRDGGWDPVVGAIAGSAWLAWRGWQMQQFRRPLSVAALAGFLVWAVGSLLVGVQASVSMPSVPLVTLEEARPVDLRAAAAGRPVVVNLWASWCGPCRQEMPTLAAVQQHEANVGVLFVNQGESQATVRAYLARLGLPLHDVLLDPGSQLGPAVGSRGLPTTLFYNAQGTVVDAHFGVLNAAALESRLQALRAAR